MTQKIDIVFEIVYKTNDADTQKLSVNNKRREEHTEKYFVISS